MQKSKLSLILVVFLLISYGYAGDYHITYYGKMSMTPTVICSENNGWKIKYKMRTDCNGNGTFFEGIASNGSISGSNSGDCKIRFWVEIYYAGLLFKKFDHIEMISGNQTLNLKLYYIQKLNRVVNESNYIYLKRNGKF